MDSTTLSLIANLGVGGILAYVMFLNHRKDANEHATRLTEIHKEHANRLSELVKLNSERADASMAFVREQATALTRVATVLDRIESRLDIRDINGDKRSARA